MTSGIRSDELRKRSYIEYHEDGLGDILVGAGALCFAFSMFWPALPLWLLTPTLILFYAPLKSRITVPRLGYARFGSRHGPDAQRFMMVLATASLVSGLMAALLAAFSVMHRSDLFYRHFPLLLGTLAAAAFAAVAVVLGIRRYYAYAALAAGLGVGANAGGWTLPGAMVGPGATMVLVGLALLVRFVRQHPVAAVEPDNAA
jgi:hypothetical protein